MSQPTRHPRLPQLDGLRAIAVLLVLTQHTGVLLLLGGWLGVDLFFALSGFLITGLLLAEIRQNATIDLARFYGRRALRLLPALTLMVAFVFLWFRPPAIDLLGSMFYFANWLRAGGNDLGPLALTWSLAVEEQFYLVWPLVILACVIVSRRFGWRLATVVAIASTLGCIAALAARLWISGGNLNPAYGVYDPHFLRIYNGTDTRLDSLMAGCLAACLAVTHRARLRQVLRLLLLPALAILLFAAVVLPTAESRPLVYTGMAAVCAVIVSALGLNAVPAVSRGLSVRPLVWIGTISYGIYLWQFPMASLGRSLGITEKRNAVFVLVTSIAFAAASYYFLERPLQQRLRPYVAVETAPSALDRADTAPAS